MSYSETFQQHLRLAVLRLLDEQPQCKANSSALHALVDAMGFAVSRDAVRGVLAWLAEHGLITLSDTAMPGLSIAVLTERGADVAAGRTRVPGVERPTPRG